MRQIKKQAALPEKMVYMENKVFGYNSISELYNNYFASIFVQDDSEDVQIFLDDIQFSEAALREEIKYIRMGFDRAFLRFFASYLTVRRQRV